MDSSDRSRYDALATELANLDIDGVVGRGSHGHEVSKTSKQDEQGA